MHEKPHEVPSQVAAPLVGTGHTAQLVPQAAALFARQKVSGQARVPTGQAPMQAIASSMQAPWHSFLPPGHAGMQATPSQVTVPAVGA